MKHIILHIGDRVHHKSLGDGVVIMVEEDHCTARFEETDAKFPIPEAFVRGSLTSEDARFVPDVPAEIQGVEVPQENREPSEDKTGMGCAIAFGLCLLIPFVIICGWFLSATVDGITGAVFTFIGIVVSIPLTIWIAKSVGESQAESSKPRPSGSGISPGTKLAAGIMTSEVINREMDREREAAEKRRYESLYWQEAIRDKNPRHNFDYDHEDDWLGTKW